jgi:leucyl aminopeptidase
MTKIKFIDKDASANCIYLANSESLTSLENFFTAEELEYTKLQLGREASSVVFANTKGVRIIELIKADNENFPKTLEKYRRAAAEKLGAIKANKVEKITINNLTENHFLEPYLEGLFLANYQFLKYSSAAEKSKTTLKEIQILKNQGIDAEHCKLLTATLEAVCIARDLVNEPLSYLDAEKMGEEFEEMGKKANFKVEVLKKKKIESLKMGGLLAVNRGSQTPPTFSILEYKPAKHNNAKPIVLVGKGVVYDTGGLSLKPTPNSMDYMKCDMGGAAVVAGIVYAVAKAKLPIHLIALIPATDNRPGENAYVPGDVVVMHSGSTVEVLNTDAEGRMILADALHYAKQYNPELVMDFATLTGAAAAAVGPIAAAIMGTASNEIKQKIQDAGQKTYERFVEFPLWDEYFDLVKSDIADLKNIGGPNSGAITAGIFLKHFTDYPWLHLDIAGVAFNHANDAYKPKGGTGTGIRIIVDFLKNAYGN